MKPAVSFQRKVELIERWAAAGRAPDDVQVPSRPEDLRRWEDPERGLTAWTSRNLAAPRGPYPELRARYDVALARLLGSQAARARTARSRSPHVSQLKLEVRTLAEQVVCLQEDLTELQQLLLLERDLRQAAEQREANLLRQMSTLRVLPGRKG